MALHSLLSIDHGRCFWGRRRLRVLVYRGWGAFGSRLDGALQGRSDRPAPAGASDELADPQERLPIQGDSVWRM